MEAGNFAAAGGVSGAIIAIGFALYKVCYRRKFHSKCCGAEIDVASEPSPTKERQIDLPPVADAPASRRPTPHPSPALKPVADADVKLQMPTLQL
jgi:hypothetical protein